MIRRPSSSSPHAETHIHTHTNKRSLTTHLHLYARAALHADGAVHHHLVGARGAVEAQLHLIWIWDMGVSVRVYVVVGVDWAVGSFFWGSDGG